MIHRFIEAWSHSRYERTGIDELLMGLTSIILIVIIVVCILIWWSIECKIRHWKTKDAKLKIGQYWTDGIVTYIIRDIYDNTLKFSLTSAYSFQQYTTTHDWRERIYKERLYLK